MRHLVVLSGNSPRNQVWGEQCLAQFGGRFYTAYLQMYDHWALHSKDIDIERELDKLAAAVKEMSGEVYVLAKSIGSILTLLAVARGSLAPQKCVFFGMPLKLAAADVFQDDWSPLSGFTVPALAYHNDHDPISYPFTKQALAAHSSGSIELITLDGDNHDYLDFADYEARVCVFFGV